MKRRQFLTISGAAITAAACQENSPAQSGAPATPQPSPTPAPRADAALLADANFPLQPLKGRSGFAMMMEGLCAFVLPPGGLGTAKRLDVLLVNGGANHEHMPSLFVPRAVWMRPTVANVTLAQQVSLDPYHATFSLQGMRVKVVQQDAPAEFPADPTPSLTFNSGPNDNTGCPTSRTTLAGFRWLLNLATELAASGKIIKDWRTKPHLYQTHLELLTGRIEHADDIVNAGTAAVGHQWKIVDNKVRYLKEILHYGLPAPKITHLQLKPINGGQAVSVFINSKDYFAPVSVMHVAKHYTNPDDVAVGYKADDLSALSGLIPSGQFTIPMIDKLRGCEVSRTPECGCCPPGYIEDLP